MTPAPLGFAARTGAAYVAMGASLFIWGGADSSSTLLNTGAIYSPTTDTWTLLPVDVHTPSARQFATAVWTGSVIIVFGGGDGTGATAYKDGAVYDPSKGAWGALPFATNRRNAAIGLWDGTRALFWGGTGSGGAPVGGADRFDLGTWTVSTNQNDPGPIASPAWAWDGSTFLLEGGLQNGNRGNKAFSYTTTIDSWANLSNGSANKSDAFGVWDGTHFVVWGGRDDKFVRNDGQYLTGNMWTNMATVGAPAIRFAPWRRSGWSFQTAPGVVAIIGGQTTFGATFAHDGAVYRIAKSQWTAVPQYPSGEDHEYGAGVWNGTEFLIWSGRSGGSPTLTGERWAP